MWVVPAVPAGAGPGQTGLLCCRHAVHAPISCDWPGPPFLNLIGHRAAALLRSACALESQSLLYAMARAMGGRLLSSSSTGWPPPPLPQGCMAQGLSAAQLSSLASCLLLGTLGLKVKCTHRAARIEAGASLPSPDLEDALCASDALCPRPQSFHREGGDDMGWFRWEECPAVPLAPSGRTHLKLFVA